VIAGRHYVHAVIEKLLADLARDPEPTRRIFNVGDDQIDSVVLHEGREPVADEIASRLADDVADEKDVHAALLTASDSNRPGCPAPILDFLERDAEFAAIEHGVGA